MSTRVDSINVYTLVRPLISILFAAGIGERLEDHLIVAAFIDRDIFSARALYLLSISRAIAIISVNPLFMAAQYLPFPDLPVSPEFFPAVCATQYKHIRLSQSL
jgi:hypothetical protein